MRTSASRRRRDALVVRSEYTEEIGVQPTQEEDGECDGREEGREGEVERRTTELPRRRARDAIAVFVGIVDGHGVAEMRCMD
jgi:hypothetical protein